MKIILSFKCSDSEFWTSNLWTRLGSILWHDQDYFPHSSIREMNLVTSSQNLVHVYLETVLSVVTVLLVWLNGKEYDGIFHLLYSVEIMTSIIQLTVQDSKHLLGDAGVLQRLPLEDGAWSPVSLGDEEIEVLASAEECWVLVVSVQNNKTWGAQQVYDEM